jgi:hypothetical protein
VQIKQIKNEMDQIFVIMIKRDHERLDMALLNFNECVAFPLDQTLSLFPNQWNKKK